MLNPLPGGAIPVDFKRPSQRVQQRLRRIVAKAEPGPLPCPRVEIVHGIVQSTDSSHHRHGAVAQAVHLIQATWLEPRRHQEQIGACLDQVCQRLVEADGRSDAIRMPRRKPEPQVFVSPLARAEQYKRGIETSELVGDLCNQIKALLIDQPRDQTHERARKRGLTGGHSKPLEQSPFCGALAAEMVGIVWLWDVGIARRIPLIVIDSVQNPDHIIAAVPQDAVKSEPEFRRLNFARIARADGRNHSAERQAAFEIADSPPVFECVDAHQVPAQAKSREPARIEHTLVSEVVDGADSRQPAERRRRAPGPQQHRNEARLPIMRVNNVETF